MPGAYAMADTSDMRKASIVFCTLMLISFSGCFPLPRTGDVEPERGRTDKLVEGATGGGVTERDEGRKVRYESALEAPKWVAALYVEQHNAVGLRWLPVPGAKEYRVLRSEVSGLNYEEIAVVVVPQYFDETADVATTHYYVLQALDGPSESAYSERREIEVPGCSKGRK